MTRSGDSSPPRLRRYARNDNHAVTMRGTLPERIIVIGAGINGLVAANYLRRAGFEVTMIERSERVGGACVSEVATVNGQAQRYALGASVLGLMQEFVFRETGLASRLETFVPDHAKRVYFPD